MQKKNKKDFKLYLDTLQVVKDMSLEEAWEFLLSCIAYWEEESFEVSRFTKLAFANTKAQFDRDFFAYINKCESNKENWIKWWRPITQDNPNNPVGYKITQHNPNNPDTDTDNDTDKDTYKETSDEFNSDFYGYIKKKESTIRTATDDVIYYFCDMWYIYKKNETISTFRNWLTELAKLYNKNGADISEIVFSWNTYWKEQPKVKQPKDCKSSFSKNPYLTNKNKYGK